MNKGIGTAMATTTAANHWDNLHSRKNMDQETKDRFKKQIEQCNCHLRPEADAMKGLRLTLKLVVDFIRHVTGNDEEQ